MQPAAPAKLPATTPSPFPPLPPSPFLQYDFFNYYPSLALAITALCLFTVAAAIVGVLTERRKTYRFMHCIT